MKVNPLGIQAYQHLNRPDRQPNEAGGSRIGQTPEQKVVIEPQATVARSPLAIKAPSGSYAKFLSVEERQALDLLFARFSDTSRFGAGYTADTEKTESDAGLGRMVDVRV